MKDEKWIKYILRNLWYKYPSGFQMSKTEITFLVLFMFYVVVATVANLWGQHGLPNTFP